MDIKNYLEQVAPVSRYWVYQGEEMIPPGLLYYMAPDGQAMIVMDDDDDKVDECVEYLISIGRPVFRDYKEMDRYIAEFGRSVRGSSE